MAKLRLIAKVRVKAEFDQRGWIYQTSTQGGVVVFSTDDHETADSQELLEQLDIFGDEERVLDEVIENCDKAYLFLESGYRGNVCYGGFALTVDGKWYNCDLVSEGVAYEIPNFDEVKFLEAVKAAGWHQV